MTVDRAPRWLWLRPEARRALATRDPGAILRCYRQLTGMSQATLAEQLGYDPSYISLVERGRRSITDRATLAYLSRALAIPPHSLGISTDDDADFPAAIQFGESTVRLAEIARQAGRAAEAVEELWPLTVRLEARLAEGRIDYPTVNLLARARATLGTSLGHVLPEEQLFMAARWTGKALVLARHLDDQGFLAHVLRMHGNELRKTRRHGAAIARLNESLAYSTDAAQRGQTLLLLSRAAGEYGDSALFDRAATAAEQMLGDAVGGGILFTPFTLREARMRGLLATGRIRKAAALADQASTEAQAPAPQWHAIERITSADVHLAVGDTESAEQNYRDALRTAIRHQLPHQIQRILRSTGPTRLPGIHAEAHNSLMRLRETALPGIPPGRTGFLCCAGC